MSRCVRIPLWLTVFVIGLGVFLAGRLEAQTFRTLHNFTGTDGASPQGGLALSGDTLYGAAGSGGTGSNGVLFAIKIDGSAFAILHNFTNSDGAGPNGGLVLGGSTLYGTASGGGMSNVGTLFAINTDGTGFQTIHSFDNIDGAGPNGGLVLSGNTLYGTAHTSGPAGGGTVFAVNTDGTSFKPLLVFFLQQPGSFVTGTFPSAGMALSGNRLYGTTPYGSYTCEGDLGLGMVFALNTGGGGFADLHSFSTNGTCPINYPIVNNDGAMPFGRVSTDGKTLYGTASTGGTEASGTVFGVNIDGTDFVTLHNFTNIDGANPNGSLVLSDNTLYGTMGGGGSGGNGTLFSLSFSPQPTVTRSGTSIVLTWPTNFADFDYSGFTLQSTTDLASPVWTTNLPAPVLVNGQYTVTNPTSGTQQFFRLSH